MSKRISLRLALSLAPLAGLIVVTRLVALGPAPQKESVAPPTDLGRAVSGEQHIGRLEVGWTTPRSWACGPARARVSTSSAVGRAGCGLPATRRARRPPSTCSSARWGCPSRSPMS
jgi:hypothetical protein